MYTSYRCQAFGKWILAGEHAVLRGVPALVFPLKSRALELEYEALESSSESLELILVGEHGKDLQQLVWGVLQKACEILKISRSQIKGKLRISSSIPVGAGMGASAALCVALAKWLGSLGFVQEQDYYEFSRSLENLFHGESSGVDIAVAISGQPLKFVRDGERDIFSPVWEPRWYISYSGKRGVTVDAVNKVKAFIANNPKLGTEVDLRMREAVALAENALHHEKRLGFPILVEAIEKAASCFESWNLNEGLPEQHIQWLKDQGAAAVKPTGSGGGGYVLSLWKEEPPKEILEKLILC